LSDEIQVFVLSESGISIGSGHFRRASYFYRLITPYVAISNHFNLENTADLSAEEIAHSVMKLRESHRTKDLTLSLSVLIVDGISLGFRKTVLGLAKNFEVLVNLCPEIDYSHNLKVGVNRSSKVPPKWSESTFAALFLGINYSFIEIPNFSTRVYSNLRAWLRRLNLLTLSKGPNSYRILVSIGKFPPLERIHLILLKLEKQRLSLGATDIEVHLRGDLSQAVLSNLQSEFPQLQLCKTKNYKAWDLVITNGGITLFEQIALGNVCIAICDYDFQIQVALELGQKFVRVTSADVFFQNIEFLPGKHGNHHNLKLWDYFRNCIRFKRSEIFPIVQFLRSVSR
jgi:spore coat polysaccharide biosynthesis predicted glycosyltransferase SpsG